MISADNGWNQVEYRGLPFWAWNCRLKKDIIKEQLKIFKKMGFGGVVIHARDGLDTEYLGTEFMDMVKYTVDLCEDMGLICWLYDDDRFPSGAADGLVTKDPQFRARQLRLTKARCERDHCAAYVIDLQEKRLRTHYRLWTEKEINEAIQNGENVWFAYMEVEKGVEWFQGNTYSDTMNPKAVDAFIKVTHERYKSALGEKFGKTASAIFTDEPRIGKQAQISEAESEEDVWIPYTEAFAKKMSKEQGLDVLDMIPEYVWDRSDGDLHNRYLYHLMTMECFANAFMDQIGDWCHANGIMMTGHILGEETLRSQTTTVGDAMRTYKNMDIPGIDILIDNREFSTVKQAASVQAQYGRTAVMSELYGVTNWDCTFRTYKLQGDWQAALGVTKRIPHFSHMSLEGEAKRDWPGSIFYQAPWYQEFPYIEDHFARLNSVLTRGKRVTKIAVLHPVESMWVASGPDDLDQDLRKSLDQSFKELTEYLLYHTLDFDYLSESLLPEQGVEYTKENWLKVGEASYQVVLVPYMLTIRNTTLDLLEKFVKNGGEVIFTGKIPQMVCGVISNRANALAEKCLCMSERNMLEEIEYLRDVGILDEMGESSANLLYQLRDDGSKWLFICHANPSDCKEEEHYTIRIKGAYSVMLWDTISGEKSYLPSETVNGWTEVKWNCYGDDSMLFRLDMVNEEQKEEYQKEKYPKEGGRKKVESSGAYKVVMKIGECASVHRTEQNVLLLDYASFCIDGGELQQQDEILRVDNKIREQLGFTKRIGMDRQPWSIKVTKAHEVTLHYEIESEINAPIQLGLENPLNSRIYWNGKEVSRIEKGWYVDQAIKVISLPSVRKGKNTMQVECWYDEKTMLENMYLLGDFDVVLEGRQAKITQKNLQQSFGDITKQGMPFYTGNLEYTFKLDVLEKKEYYIHVSEFMAPVLAICLDGRKQGLVAYAPYRLSLGSLESGKHEIKVILYGNRFNSFGMLHNANPNYVWYGNGSYRTTGKEWTDDYMLRTVGILSEIQIETFA